MSRITFDGREVEAFEVEKVVMPNRRMTQPLAEGQPVQFANPAGDEYVAYLYPAHVVGLRPGTSGLYEHDGVSESVTITAVPQGFRRAPNALLVSTGLYTVLFGALAGTLIEPGPGTALGAAAALIGTIGVGMPLATLLGARGADERMEREG